MPIRAILEFFWETRSVNTVSGYRALQRPTMGCFYSLSRFEVLSTVTDRSLGGSISNFPNFPELETGRLPRTYPYRVIQTCQVSSNRIQPLAAGDRPRYAGRLLYNAEVRELQTERRVSSLSTNASEATATSFKNAMLQLSLPTFRVLTRDSDFHSNSGKRVPTCRELRIFVTAVPRALFAYSRMKCSISRR